MRSCACFGNVLTSKVLGQLGNDRQILMTITKLLILAAALLYYISDCIICISIPTDLI